MEAFPSRFQRVARERKFMLPEIPPEKLVFLRQQNGGAKGPQSSHNWVQTSSKNNMQLSAHDASPPPEIAGWAILLIKTEPEVLGWS